MQDSDFIYLGQCVREARKRCNLTQQELSDQSGVGLRHIQNIEKGIINPSYECLSALINRLGISANSLFHSNMPSQETELERFIGKYLACTEEERQILLHTAESLAEQFISRHPKTDESEAFK